MARESSRIRAARRVTSSRIHPKRFFQKATGWGKFGAGIDTSSTSSKFACSTERLVVELTADFQAFPPRSNDYSKNMGIHSDLKALLLNKVVVGNGKKLTRSTPSLTAPPAGYDSVSGMFVVR